MMFSLKADDGIERTAEQYFKRYNAKDPSKGGAKKFNYKMVMPVIQIFYFSSVKHGKVI